MDRLDASSDFFAQQRLFNEVHRLGDYGTSLQSDIPTVTSITASLPATLFDGCAVRSEGSTGFRQRARRQSI
jgi:hypothetical protein